MVLRSEALTHRSFGSGLTPSTGTALSPYSTVVGVPAAVAETAAATPLLNRNSRRRIPPVKHARDRRVGSPVLCDTLWTGTNSMPFAANPHDEPGRLTDPKFDRITRLASQIANCPIAWLSFSGAASHGIKSSIGMDQSSVPLADSICSLVLLSDHIVVVPDVLADSRFAGSQTDIHFIAAAPLLTPRGVAIGALCVMDTQARSQGLAANEVALLTELAALAVDILDATPTPDEEALRNSDKQFRAIFAKAPLGLVITHEDGRLIEANEAYRDLTGYSEDELRAVNFISLTHPDEIENNRALFQRLVNEEISSYVLEKRIFQKSGDVRWVRAHAAIVRQATGKAFQVVGLVEDITDRKNAEIRFRFLAESIPQMVWTATSDGMLDYVNHQGGVYFGVPETLLLGAGWLDWVHPEDQTKAVERWSDSLKTGANYETEFRLKRGADSSWRLHLVRALPMMGSTGAVVQWFGTCTDIEDQTQAARQIEEDRRRWRDLLFQIPAGIALLHGSNHTFEWANAELARLIGQATESIAGKTIQQYLPEVLGLDAVYKTGQPAVGQEVRLGPREDHLHDVFVNYVCLPTRDTGGHIDGILAYVVDITAMVEDRRRVEESERQFRNLAEAIPVLTWMADPSGHIFWYNRRWYDYTGTTFEEMEGWGWQKVHDAEYLPEVLKSWTAALSSGEPFDMTFPLRRFDGEFRPFLTRVNPIRDGKGAVVRWFGTNTDIADQRRTEQQLRRINLELEEFSYAASHDLQEPLRMVNIYTELMMAKVDGPREDLENFAGLVRSGVKQMRTLIEDLLSFLRSVHEDQLVVGTADLSAACAQALEVLKSRIEETEAVITTGSLPFTVGDTSQMAHVFQNILSNSLKYRKTGVAPQIHVEATRDKENWLIAIRDNGIGFEAQYADRIFGLFKRLHKDEYPGTGLGLAICKRIVERYGGRMWAEGVEGQGATFYFSLPRSAGAPVEAKVD